MWYGEFNSVLDPDLDRCPPRRSTKPRMTKQLHQMMHNLGLRDIWRDHHPTHKLYSCFTPTHNTYSRLDRILATEYPAFLSAEITHLARSLSNHAPVSCTVQWADRDHGPRCWRLPMDLLEDQVGRDPLSQTLKEYISLNWNTTDNRANEWDAMKAVDRGQEWETSPADY